jgi:hypothetical protein
MRVQVDVKGINSGVLCLSEGPLDSDVTIQLAMLSVRSRYLFPLRYVCRYLQLKDRVNQTDETDCVGATDREDCRYKMGSVERFGSLEASN